MTFNLAESTGKGTAVNLHSLAFVLNHILCCGKNDTPPGEVPGLGWIFNAIDEWPELYLDIFPLTE